MIRRILDSLVSRFSRHSLHEEMFYAVSRGRKVGIYPTWAQCEAQVKGYPGAQFKKFSSHEEAQSFIQGSGGPEIVPVLPRGSQALKPFENLKKTETSLSVTTNQNNLMASSGTRSQSGNYYAVAKGKNVGVYFTWPECKEQIDGFGFPKYKKFATLEEAENFIQENQSTKGTKFSHSTNPPPKKHSTVPHDSDICTRKLSSVSFRDYCFQRDENGYVHCYTDGSCESNGQIGAKAGIGVWFGVDHPLNVGEPVIGPPTNNVAEIQAATKAIKVAQDCGIPKLQINTDSQFLIKCITQWMPKWQRNGWKLSTGGDVKNREQLEELHNALKKKIDIKWNYVKAHKGIEGNEHADMLAKAGASNYKLKGNLTDSVRFKPY